MLTPSDLALLSQNRWLARQAPALREALLSRARVQAIGRGQWIYGTGDALNGLYGVLEGTVHLLVTPDGQVPRLIDIVQPGQLFGQAARFGGGPRLVTAIAGEPARLLHVPDSALAEIARKADPDIWRRMTTLLYGQLAGALVFADLMRLPPGKRIEARLALLAANASPPPPLSRRTPDLVRGKADEWEGASIGATRRSMGEDRRRRTGAHPPPVGGSKNLRMLSSSEAVERRKREFFGEGAVRIPITQSQLAEMTGLSRKTVNSHLRRLERRGAITIGYRSLAVVRQGDL